MRSLSGHVSLSGLRNPFDTKPNCENYMKRNTNFLAVQAHTQTASIMREIIV